MTPHAVTQVDEPHAHIRRPDCDLTVNAGRFCKLRSKPAAGSAARRRGMPLAHCCRWRSNWSKNCAGVRRPGSNFVTDPGIPE